MVLEGGGVPIRRALPSRNVPYAVVDPFLLLDEGQLKVTGKSANFPIHPHRGFEIVTYSLRGPLGQKQIADGREERASVAEGGLLRITAGRGMAHGEGSEGQQLPPEGLEVHILQLWINLARADKGVEPSYQTVDPAQIPEQTWGKARVRVLVGEGSPVQLHTPALYLDLDLPAGERVEAPVPEGWQGFAYLVGGSGRFGADEKQASAGDLVVLGPGAAFPVTAEGEGVRFVLAAGRPYGEAPRWNGSFVD
jgi:redox-sensitive bicupin YhaK (pirin superfamily)